MTVCKRLSVSVPVRRLQSRVHESASYRQRYRVVGCWRVTNIPEKTPSQYPHLLKNIRAYWLPLSGSKKTLHEVYRKYDRVIAQPANSEWRCEPEYRVAYSGEFSVCCRKK